MRRTRGGAGSRRTRRSRAACALPRLVADDGAGNQLVEDLGEGDLAARFAQSPPESRAWLERAAETAAAIAGTPDPGLNPPFDAALFRRELDLARQAVFELFLERPLSPAERAVHDAWADGARARDPRTPFGALPPRLPREQPLPLRRRSRRHRLPGSPPRTRRLRPRLAALGAHDARLDDRGDRARRRGAVRRAPRPRCRRPRLAPAIGSCSRGPGRSAAPSPGRSWSGGPTSTAATSRGSWRSSGACSRTPLEDAGFRSVLEDRCGPALLS